MKPNTKKNSRIITGVVAFMCLFVSIFALVIAGQKDPKKGKAVAEKNNTEIK